MIVGLIAYFLFLFLINPVSSTTLTYILKSSEKACFYAFAAQSGQKISFYFAVQNGGDFDIDYSITGPSNTLIYSGIKERQSDYVFAAPVAGEYAFCFSNGIASYADKFIDFDISVKDDSFSIKAELPEEKPQNLDHLTPLENSIYNLGASLNNIARLQKYFRTRENRNFATVKSTVGRIYYFSMLECFLIVSMAAVQVFVIKTFFKTTKGRV